MNKVFDLLQKHGLTNDEQIQSAIMHGWGVKDIFDFNDRLLEAINVHAPGNADITAFNFIANSDLSAQHKGACIEWNCRLRRVDCLARFAALYSDRVYIQNYFADYAHASNSEFDLRYFYTGDLKILLKLRPLLESGILCLIQSEPGFHLCASCAAKFIPGFESISSKLEKQVDALSEEYLPKTHAAVLRYSPLDDICTIGVKGP